MFGTLKPHACSLDQTTQKQHMRYYCGSCHSLGNNFGPSTALRTDKDPTFQTLPLKSWAI